MIGETSDDISAELRELSMGAKYCELQPKVFGKPIGTYFAELADRLDAWAKRDGVLRVPVDVWNDMARKVESADALRGVIGIIEFKDTLIAADRVIYAEKDGDYLAVYVDGIEGGLTYENASLQDFRYAWRRAIEEGRP